MRPGCGRLEKAKGCNGGRCGQRGGPRAEVSAGASVLPFQADTENFLHISTVDLMGVIKKVDIPKSDQSPGRQCECGRQR